MITHEYAALVTRQRQASFIEMLCGGAFFLGYPDRWFEEPGPYFRCTKGHVSHRVLLTEHGDRCLAAHCYKQLMITFPEDVEEYVPWEHLSAQDRCRLLAALEGRYPGAELESE